MLSKFFERERINVGSNSIIDKPAAQCRVNRQTGGQDAAGHARSKPGSQPAILKPKQQENRDRARYHGLLGEECQATKQRGPCQVSPHVEGTHGQSGSADVHLPHGAPEEQQAIGRE